MEHPLYTFGYSTLEIEPFLAMLKKHDVDVVCDVRSVPYSQRRPSYSRPQLKSSLNSVGIKYAFFGDELGARPKSRNVYINGQAVYDLIAKQDFFQRGLERIYEGVKKCSLALLCAERDPIECHRAILVCRHLKMIRNNIFHIHSSGKVESQIDFERRLVSHHGLEPLPLLDSGAHNWEITVQEAYESQGKQIAYTENDYRETKAMYSA